MRPLKYYPPCLANPALRDEVKECPDSKPEIIIKEKPDTDAICTPHNPETRYVRKGKQRVTGDKAFVTETCDPENKTQFITDIELEKATEPDTKQQVEIQERLIANDFKPEKQYNQAPKDQKRSAKTGKMIVHFDPGVCGACSFAQAHRCPVKVGKRVATYNVDEAEYACLCVVARRQVGAIRHHRYMGDSQYRKECAIRAGVEATVSELTRAHGLRNSRHRKRERTKLQLIFATIACNVKRFIRHGEQYVYLELEMKPAG